ncbi:MAG: hypothetical protein LH631_12480, partial [Alkalinema sp. CAN_BIN05]|nr:hypothetical protein [Alkalinema sp. CAN_BIN05]
MVYLILVLFNSIGYEFTHLIFLGAIVMFLQVDQLSKQFTTKQGPLAVLQDINLSIQAGEFV